MRLLVAGVVLAVQVSVSADGTHLREDPSEPAPGDLEAPEKASAILAPVGEEYAGGVKQWVKAEMCEDSAPQECAFTCEPHCPVGVCATRIGTCCQVQAPCKDSVHLTDAVVCEHSSPQATSQQCDPIKCHDGECAMRVDDYYQTGNDCHFECQAPIGTKAASLCPTSPDQHCKMECPPKICPEDQCAMRSGDCCDFKCVNTFAEEKNHAMTSLKAQMGTKADELQAAEAAAEQAAEGLDCEGADKETSECEELAAMREESKALMDHIEAKINLNKQENALHSTMDEAKRRQEDWAEEEEAKASKAQTANLNAEEAIEAVGRGLSNVGLHTKSELEEMDLESLKTLATQMNVLYEDTPSLSKESLIGAIMDAQRAGAAAETYLAAGTTGTSTYPAELGWENGKRERDAMAPVVGPLYIPTPTDANDPEWTAGSGPTYRRRRRQIGGVDHGHQVADTGPRWDGTTGVDTPDRGLVSKPSEVPTKGAPDGPPGDPKREPNEALDQPPHAEAIDPDDSTTPAHTPEKPAGAATSGEDAPATDLPPPAADPSSQPTGQA